MVKYGPIHEVPQHTVTAHGAGAVTERYHELIDTGTGIGGARSGGVSGIDNVIQVFAGQPMLRITRLSADPYRVVVRLIVWEQDA